MCANTYEYASIAHHPLPNMGTYNATKAALTSLAKTTALEEAPNGVRVNIISPGPILTEMVSWVAGKTYSN